jgi:20S proteasome subunit beta 3
MTQSVLYERRFGPYFVEPVIAGLEDGNKPYLCAMDLIGAPLKTDDFVLAGTSSQAMFGLAETLWKPDLEPEQLFEVISQVLLNAVDRDALAGWGARVYLMTPDKLITRDLRARQD